MILLSFPLHFFSPTLYYFIFHLFSLLSPPPFFLAHFTPLKLSSSFPCIHFPPPLSLNPLLFHTPQTLLSSPYIQFPLPFFSSSLSFPLHSNLPPPLTAFISHLLSSLLLSFFFSLPHSSNYMYLLPSLRVQVEQFWAHYCYLARPCELPSHCDIHLFKKGIKPMWEVSENFCIV